MAEGGGRGKRIRCLVSVCRGVFSWDRGSGGIFNPYSFFMSAAALVAELFYNVAQLLSVSHSCVSTTFSF